MELVFTANSPGEVSTWLAPVVRAVRARTPEARISVFLVPCAFATGAEEAVVRAMGGVDRVYSPAGYWRHALTIPEVKGFDKGRGALLYLGGDPFHAAWLARRLRLPALAYMERGSRFGRSFQEIFVPDEAARRRVVRRGVPEDRVRIVGDLMIDAVRPQTGRSQFRAALGLDDDKPVLAVFPGSRMYEIRQALPFLLRAVEIAAEGRRELQCVVSLSPFVSPADLDVRPVPRLEGTRAKIVRDRERWRVVTERGLEVPAVHGNSHDVMQAADLALTIPGSNTAEMAALGLPMVVALPLNLAETIPLPGIAHYLERLPWVGARWKRALVVRRAMLAPFVAWPNRKAGRAIVPEVKGFLRPEDVALEAARLLADGKARARMARELREVMGPAGAAGTVAERLLWAARQAAGGGGGR